MCFCAAFLHSKNKASSFNSPSKVPLLALYVEPRGISLLPIVSGGWAGAVLSLSVLFCP